MAAPRDFDAFSRTELEPVLQELEPRRRRVILIGGGALLAVGALVCLFVLGRGGGFILLLLLIIPVLLIWWYFAYQAFRNLFKETVILPVIKFLDPNLGYSPEGMIDRSVFIAGRIFTEGIDNYAGEDYVRGKVGQTSIRFSQVHAEHVSGDGKDKKHQTIFKGLYFVADFNKHFHTRTVVVPDTAERVFGFLGQALQAINPNRAKLIRLEDPEFEREFAVYGEDQVEARYILSPALMQRMLALQRKTGRKTYFSFTGSEIHVAITTDRDYFEPEWWTPAQSPGTIGEYYRDLCQVIELVEDLNLNTRIWSKE